MAKGMVFQYAILDLVRLPGDVQEEFIIRELMAEIANSIPAVIAQSAVIEISPLCIESKSHIPVV